MLIAISITATACHSSRKSEVVYPEGTLGVSEINELFSNKTVKSITVGRGRVSDSYYEPGGRIYQVRNGLSRKGFWRITPDAQICLRMSDQNVENCRIIVYENGVFRKYRPASKGQFKPVVDYVSFQDGNRLGLCRLRCIDVYHPLHAELIRHHAKQLSPKRFFQRHDYLAILRQGFKPLMRLFF